MPISSEKDYVYAALFVSIPDCCWWGPAKTSPFTIPIKLRCIATPCSPSGNNNAESSFHVSWLCILLALHTKWNCCVAFQIVVVTPLQIASRSWAYLKGGLKRFKELASLVILMNQSIGWIMSLFYAKKGKEKSEGQKYHRRTHARRHVISRIDPLVWIRTLEWASVRFVYSGQTHIFLDALPVT